MSTSYTSIIENGATFQQYALRCARAFGILLHMKDESIDAEIPDEIKLSTVAYHENELKENIEEKNKLLSITESDKIDNVLKHNNDMLCKYRKQKKRISDLMKKYNDMLNQCKKYEPPTKDHIEFKNFMISQIVESIEFDCYPTTKPKEFTSEEYYNLQLKEVNWNIEYHTRKLIEEKKRMVDGNIWIQSLKKSLGI
jgi:hypothetical protein